MQTPSPSYLSAMRRFSKASALLVAGVGAAVLLGWSLDIPLLKSVLPGLAVMKVNTACAFLAAGIALRLTHASTRSAIIAAQMLALLVAAIGGLTLTEHITGVDLGIDQLILRVGPRVTGAMPPGRMTPAASLNFLLLGAALFALKADFPRIPTRWAYWLALPPLPIATIAIVGYVYGVDALYNTAAYSSMAAHTAASFLLLSVAILAADPSRWIGTIATSTSAGGMVARRLLPTIPIVLFLIGWAGVAGENAGLFNMRFGLAVIVALSMTVTVLAVSFTASTLHAVDVARTRALAEIVALNAGLEQRVKERTKELEDTLAEVRQLSGLLPICAWCKQIRDDKNYWQSVEQYIGHRTGVQFSHGICPTCLAKHLPEDMLVPAP